jgi:stalled ribosome alternative rescue factor ArfA
MTKRDYSKKKDRRIAVDWNTGTRVMRSKKGRGSYRRNLKHKGA